MMVAVLQQFAGKQAPVVVSLCTYQVDLFVGTGNVYPENSSEFVCAAVE